jgi:catechol 2,3-dioxygenase-like lactoylglutathione lyase family enzyme
MLGLVDPTRGDISPGEEQRIDSFIGPTNLKEGRNMAKIGHIAILAADPAKLAEFYKTAFGLKEVARSGENGEAIYVSDGNINLALLPARNRREGIYHFGMKVEDVKDAAKTALAAGATGGKAELPRDGRFAETFVLDPVGTRVDLSSGWKT